MIICNTSDNSMDNLAIYLKSVLNVEVEVIPLEKLLAKSLPLYITSAYSINEAYILGHRVCFLESSSEEQPSPDRLAKQMALVESKVGLPAIFVTQNIASYNLKRYVQKGINFIVPHRQLFIPALLMDFQKPAVTQKKDVEQLLPSAQFVLLYHLQKKSLSNLTVSEIAKELSQTYITTIRAVNMLKDLDLCVLSPTANKRENAVEFHLSRYNLWQKALPYLQNPIQKVVYTDDEVASTKSGINALAHYSMLNDEPRHYYAVSKEQFRESNIATDSKFGDNTIEVWKYNPLPLSEQGFVDRLSLYLTFTDNEDERIQGELENVINEFEW